ncbi:MAG TPA: hypothetical protein VFR47_03985 [Anaerolineales bacterium]|nr:hypothetical protein [Anaerolineales bacterium]
MKNIRPSAWFLMFLLAGCSQQTVPPTVTPVPATQTTVPANIPNTEPPTSIPFTLTVPGPTADLTLFGEIGTGEIQAYALESVANAIFKKTMDGFVADGRIQEYQVTSVTIFPGSNGWLSEITFNLRTTDPGWIAGGGTPANDDWLIGQCLRFDFFATETEYQLKNRRLCG